MNNSMDLEAKKTVISNIPLLSFDKQTIVGRITLTNWEENRDHYIHVSKGPFFEGQTFTGWSAKVALDELRKALELEGALITLGGALVYAEYSHMCHDMGGGLGGYNYKNRMPSDKTIPEMIVTFDVVADDEYPFVGTIAEQSDFWDKRLESLANPKKTESRKWTLSSFLNSILRRNSK